VAVVYRGIEPEAWRVKVYLDGVRDNVLVEKSATIAASAAPLWVGCLPSANAPDMGFVGLIDEVYIWNRALAETEIDVLYRQR
jgi:hypothetical protein